MVGKQTRNIKFSQKEALLLREISQLIHQVTLDEPSLVGIFVTSVKLSANKSLLTVFFSTPTATEQDFKEKLKTLILYKPSIRSSLSKKIAGRYTPNIVFKFDKHREKQQKIESLLEQVRKDDKA